MKAGIIYFSGTGNTFRVSEVFREYLKYLGYDSDYIDVTNGIKEDLNSYDLLIFGTPTYSKVASKNVVNFIRKLHFRNPEKVNAVTFASHSWGETYGHTVLSDELKKKGIRVLSSIAVLMPNNHYALTGKMSSKDEQIDMYTNVIAKVEALVSALDKGLNVSDSGNAFKKNAFKQLYKVLQRKWIPNYGINYLSVEKGGCIACNQCVNNCPNHNIVNSNGKIDIQDKCIACTKCYNACPANAFLVKGRPVRQYKDNKTSIKSKLTSRRYS